MGMRVEQKGVRENKIEKLGDKTKRKRKQNQKLSSGLVTTSEFFGHRFCGFVPSKTIEKPREEVSVGALNCQVSIN